MYFGILRGALEDKATLLKLGDFNKLSSTDKKKIIDQVEYPAYLFLNNSNAKMHTQLKKDVVNDYSKENTNAYPNNIHKTLTLMNEYKPLKLDTPTIPVQGTAFVTGAKGKKKQGGDKAAVSDKCLTASEWSALSPEAQMKIIEARKKSKANDDDDKSTKSTASSESIKSLSKTLKSLEKSNQKLKRSVSALQKCKEDDDSNLSISSSEGTSHFQKALETLKEHNPKIVLALKSRKFTDLDLRNVLLLDNLSTFDLCCNKKFASKIWKAINAFMMMSNGGGLRITN